MQKFLSLTIISQALAALVGLLLTHWMETTDYAIYIIYITTAGAISGLTKGGANLGLSAIVGKVWPDISRSKQVLLAANSERLATSAILLPPTLMFGVWILNKTGADYKTCSYVVFGLLAHWAFEYFTKTREQIIQFAGEAQRIQASEILGSITRLITIVGCYYLGLLTLAVSLLATALGSLIRLPLIWGRAKKILGPEKVELQPADRIFIRGLTFRQIPVDFFFVLQMQFVMFLLSTYGKTENIAEFGALGRIGQLLSPIAILVTGYIVPKYAAQQQHIRLSAFKWLGIISTPGFLLVAISILTPDFVLLLLGSQYGHLAEVLPLFCAGVAASVSGTAAMQLVGNRGLNHWAFLQIPTVVLISYLGFRYIDFRDLSGILFYLLLLPAGQFLAFLADLYLPTPQTVAKSVLRKLG